MPDRFARLIPILVLLPTGAYAHPGDHARNGFVTNLRHILGEPDHLAMLTVAAIAVGVVVYLRKGRQS